MSTQEAVESFSRQSGDYAAARPRYPAALFDWLAEHSPGRRLAWDCATGNGQAAAELALRFDRVEATDVSAEQLAAAFKAPNLHYSVQPAEQTSFEDHGFDLITVAQALHWFDFARFWPEARRVGRPGALFCAWGYSWMHGDARLEAEFIKPLVDLLAPFWAANNATMWRGYRPQEVGFPLQSIETPSFAIEVNWSGAELVRYTRTWSAYKRAEKDLIVAAELLRLEEELGMEERFDLRMPLVLLAGRVL